MSALLGSVRDLLPIVMVIAFFQIIVLQQAPDNLMQTLVGLFPSHRHRWSGQTVLPTDPVAWIVYEQIEVGIFFAVDV